MRIGASLSTKYCKTLGIDCSKLLQKSIEELDLKQYRLMSYWDDIEAKKGEFDFTDLDAQFRRIEKSGRKITLSVGLRQPRWPESHPPQWARELREKGKIVEFTKSVIHFNRRVVERYKNSPALISYQLENEALNKGIGHNIDYSRYRLRREYEKLKAADSKHPIIMSVSDNMGIPVRAPRADMVGFSMYLSQHDGKRYRRNLIPLTWFRIRKMLIEATGRPVIIHELQAEPWGPQGTDSLSLDEQEKSMNLQILRSNLLRAKKLGVEQVDLWGLEWWYWRKVKFGDDTIWDGVQELLVEFHERAR